MQDAFVSWVLLVAFATFTAAEGDVGCTKAPTPAPPDFEVPPWLTYMTVLFLLSLSALFSGLTLGLLSLDINGLKIIIDAGSENERKWATSIMPVRANGEI